MLILLRFSSCRGEYEKKVLKKNFLTKGGSLLSPVLFILQCIVHLFGLGPLLRTFILFPLTSHGFIKLEVFFSLLLCSSPPLCSKGFGLPCPSRWGPECYVPTFVKHLDFTYSFSFDLDNMIISVRLLVNLSL